MAVKNIDFNISSLVIHDDKIMAYDSGCGCCGGEDYIDDKEVDEIIKICQDTIEALGAFKKRKGVNCEIPSKKKGGFIVKLSF